MVRVKSQTEIQAAYAGAAGRASTAYRTAVGLVTDWQTKATADSAETNYSDGVTEAVAGKTRQKALQKVSNADWQTNAQTLGAPRLTTGITQNAAKQASHFEPSRAVIAGFVLQPKTRDAATNIANRMTPLALALEAKKKELTGK